MMNGDGLRTVLFVSGCSHHCPSCHNPQTHDPCYGHQFTIGTMTEIMESLRMEFCAGLTLSGGDPLYPDNRNEVMRIVETVKGEFGNEKTIWLYTGYTYGELKKQPDGVEPRNFLILILGIPLFILSGYWHSIADAFYYGVSGRFDISMLWLYPMTVVGNYLGCNAYNLFVHRSVFYQKV